MPVVMQDTVTIVAELPRASADRVLTLLESEEADIVVVDHRELTPSQASKVLGISRPLVSRLINNGELPARKVGSHWRIPAEAISTYRSKNLAKRQGSLDAYTEAMNSVDF